MTLGLLSVGRDESGWADGLSVAVGCGGVGATEAAGVAAPRVVAFCCVAVEVDLPWAAGFVWVVVVVVDTDWLEATVDGVSVV